MAKEKVSSKQKRAVAQINPVGKQQMRGIAQLLNVSVPTAYKARKEGNYLNKIDELELINRQMQVENQILKSQFAVSKHQRSNGRN